MKFEIDRKRFAAALALAAKAIPPRVVNPVMGRVLVRATAETGAVELVAGSAEATVGLTLAADVTAGGAAMMSKEAAVWTRDRRGDRLTVSAGGDRLTVSDGDDRCAGTKPLSPDAYPDPAVEGGGTLTVPVSTLLPLVSAATAATGEWSFDNDTALNRAAVCLWATEGGELLVGATDQKLFVIGGACRTPTLKAAVPARAAALLTGLLAGSDGDATVTFVPDEYGHCRLVVVRAGGHWLRCPMAASKTPPANQVRAMADRLTGRFAVDVAALAGAVKSAAAAMDRKAARMELSVGGGRLTVTGVGEYDEAAACVPCAGECRPFAVAGDYLRAMAQSAAALGEWASAELAVDPAAPELVALFVGPVVYAIKALTAAREK